MPYHADFTGAITVDPPLNADERSYLDDFAKTRHVQSGNGPLYVGRGRNLIITNFNEPQPPLPGVWCDWVPTPDGATLFVRDTEGFYHPVEWMQFIIQYLLSPAAVSFIEEHKTDDPRLDSFTCDHALSGEVLVEGQERDDVWRLLVTSNIVHVTAGAGS